MKLGRIQRRREHVAPAIVVLALCGVVRLAAAQGTPDILWQVDGHDDTVQGIDFSPDGRRLATGADYWDNTVKVWNAGDGTLSQTLPGRPQRRRVRRHRRPASPPRRVGLMRTSREPPRRASRE